MRNMCIFWTTGSKLLQLIFQVNTLSNRTNKINFILKVNSKNSRNKVKRQIKTNCFVSKGLNYNSVNINFFMPKIWNFHAFGFRSESGRGPEKYRMGCKKTWIIWPSMKFISSKTCCGPSHILNREYCHRASLALEIEHGPGAFWKNCSNSWFVCLHILPFYCPFLRNMNSQ